jgi:hypothetical protein
LSSGWLPTVGRITRACGRQHAGWRRRVQAGLGGERRGGGGAGRGRAAGARQSHMALDDGGQVAGGGDAHERALRVLVGRVGPDGEGLEVAERSVDAGGSAGRGVGFFDVAGSADHLEVHHALVGAACGDRCAKGRRMGRERHARARGAWALPGVACRASRSRTHSSVHHPAAPLGAPGGRSAGPQT